MHHDPDIPSELGFEEVEPLQAVGAFEHIIAEDPAAAHAGGGVVRREDVKAAAVVVFPEHTRGLRVLGVIAVDDKGDLTAEFRAAGEVKALQRLAAVRAYRVAQMNLPAQLFRRRVAPHIVVPAVSLFVKQSLAQTGAAPQERVSVDIRGGIKRYRGRRRQKQLFHVSSPEASPPRSTAEKRR